MTAAELIASALRLAGAIASGETPDASEYADGLDSLNDLLENWTTEGLTPYARVYYEFPLTNGVTSYTIGPGATWSMPRPIRVVTASIGGRHVDVQFDGGYPTGRVVIPEGLDGMITIVIDSQFTKYTEPTDLVSLPPGYSRALRYGLAIEFAGEYGIPPNKTVVMAASESKADLKRANIRVPKLTADPAMLPRNYWGQAWR